MSKKPAGFSPVRRYGQYSAISLLILVVGCVLLNLAYRDVKRKTIEDLNARQFIHAKQAVRGIESFFNDHIRILEQLALNESIVHLDEAGKRTIREFLSTRSRNISIISRVDSQGRILHAEPHNPTVIGQPVTSMEYFEEAKRSHRVVVSDVFTNRRGFKSVVIHVPISVQGRFDGTLAALFPFDVIAGRFIEDIRIGENGYAWVISRKGIEISCPVPGHVGNSVFDNCRDYPDILAMAERMIRGEQGTATYTFNRVRENIVTATTKHAVFMPIRLGETFWSIVVASPEDEVTGSLLDFRNRLLLIAVLLVIGMGILFYLTFRTRLMVQEMEQKRRTQEELDRYFTESLDLLCITDTDGCFKKLNLEWEKTLGYGLHELEGHSVTDFIHTGDLQASQAFLDDLRKGKAVGNFVNRWRCKDGTYRWLEWRAYLSGDRISGIARDITRRKQIEDALRESETKYRDIFENATEGIYQTTPEGRYLSVNPAFARMFGFASPGEMIATINDIGRQLYVHPEDRERLKALLTELGRVEGFETQVYRRDGRIIWISINARAVRDETGAILHYEGTNTDITEHKLAEESLRNSEHQLSQIIEFLPDATLVIDSHGRVVAWNRALEALTGVKSQEMIGKGDLEYALPLYGKRTPILIDLALHQRPNPVQKCTGISWMGDTLAGESFVSNLPRGPAHISATASVLRDAAGRVIGAIECIRDITERWSAEEALRESEERWQFALEGAGDGVWDWDPQTNVVYFSRQWKAMLGYDEYEIGNTLDEWEGRVHPDDHARVLREIGKHFAGQESIYTSEHRVRCKDGSYKWVLDRGKVVRWTEDGKPLRVIGTHTDITPRMQAGEEHRRLQEQLSQAQKMEAVGRLAAGVAHDLNNLLTPILGYTEMLLDQLDSSGKAFNQVKIIQQAGELSRDLIRQLLAFSRKQILEIKVFDLCALVRDMGKMLRRTIRESIVIETRLSPDECSVWADQGQATQVLMNLAVNAQDAMPEGGTLTIEASPVRLDEEYCRDHIGSTPGEYVMLGVSDTGCGMDREALQHIFEPFFTTKKGSGTGLGLATVYGIVKQHGGYIWVDSEPETGTVFKVYLPAARGQAVAEEDRPKTIKSLRGSETILVVEDNPMARDLAGSILQRQGYTVLGAGSAEEARKCLSSHEGPVHLLLTDVIMPDMNGKALSEELQRVWPELRVIFMSGYADDIIANHGVLLEGVHFIRKPFEARELIEMVRGVLNA